MTQKPKFLVLTGDGINCERETAFALEQAQGKTQIMHINDLLLRPEVLGQVQGLIFPGGFSFGDELGSGQILALKLRHTLQEQLQEFLQKPRAVLGVCNGFQVLVKLGVLPFKSTTTPELSLSRNDHGQFIDRWVELKVAPQTHCHWLQNIAPTLSMPARHGEGRLVLPPNQSEIKDRLKNEKLAALYYSEDINGSYEQIAGLTDPSGWVLGLMPHPEAASFYAQSLAQGRLERGQALKTLPAFGLFTSIVKALNEH